MPRSGRPGTVTPSAASAATPPGMSPSPHALSTGAARGSTTTASIPASAAWMAVASPAGPPPATSTSITSVDGRSAARASASFSQRIRTTSSAAFSTVNASAVTQAVCTSGSASPSTTTAT